MFTLYIACIAFFSIPIQMGAKNIIRTMRTTIKRTTNFLHRNIFVLHPQIVQKQKVCHLNLSGVLNSVAKICVRFQHNPCPISNSIPDFLGERVCLK
jgi:hypothetical protein